ncbi:MAG TPA: tRNA pseudouridine(38-40) synthase TruA [Saprospirales bacterium]|nr:tRNA pseudouridine(38-40) synthase TruA [Saprospirales bacterium]HRQ29068.1 tRNA pseudouridine synthase A [Saprospiraceae bacterium]
MRYRAQISYVGTNFCGWQNQPNGVSVQEILENRLSIKLQQEIQITGCCRTDAGVHALKSYFHFDYEHELPIDFLYSMNHLLPFDIALRDAVLVNSDFHARFDAMERSYIYKLHGRKDPFKQNRSFYFPQIRDVDKKVLEEAALIFKENREFEPFCKTMSDVKTKVCELNDIYWHFDLVNDEYEFHISANRFLRGMVRLIVGASLQFGLGKMHIQELRESFRTQCPLSKPWSVPAEGLYLKEIKYSE